VRAVIICGGEIGNLGYIRSFINDGDTVICADSGFDRAVRLGAEPDIVLGDMDSVSGDYTKAVFEKFPVEKDWTDSELAVNYVIDKGFDSAVLLGCTGSRADHSLANIFLLRRLEDSGVKAVIINDDNMIYMPKNGIKLRGRAGDIVSVLPISERVTGYTARGLYYSAENLTLEFGKTLANSNHMISEECEVSWKTGEAVVIKTHD
jgi:thiamine pyrophosphokinase